MGKKVDAVTRRIRARKALYQRQSVWVSLEVDWGRLYGPLPQAAQYLAELAAQYADKPGARLVSDYDYDVHKVTVGYSRPETPQEYRWRLEQERWQRNYAEQERLRAEQRRQDVAAYNALGRKLGYR